MALRGTGVQVAGRVREDEDHKGIRAEGSRRDDRLLRILVHDFAGHPFQVDLSRTLARRGHQVLHVYCESYTSGKGRLDVDADEPGLAVAAVPVGQQFARYAPTRRVVQELAYGRRFVAAARRFRPDVVLACNVPLLAQVEAARWLRRAGIPWVFWMQDLYSVAAGAEAEVRAGIVGRAIGHGFERLERRLVSRASQVVAITEDFRPHLARWGAKQRCSVIENWAPLADLPERPRDNAWRWNQGLGDRFVFLYSGTLGLKHRPELLYDLAAQHVDDAEVVVISEGRGEARLRELLAARPVPNLRVLPFQPFEDYPDVIAAADVLVALLEPTAGRFSVPSKVLSYLCAGRPVLGAIPLGNLAARTIERAGAGLVVPPTDQEAFLLAAKRLRGEPSLRSAAGTRARAYAERTFDTERVTERFLAVIDDALDPRRAP
ncbi:MAG: glycosyltransferase family 4 protein [Acidimicrobiales bacterium]